MKINGQKVEGPNEELVIIPRGDSSIAFKCKAVLTFDDFEKLCPDPKPPQIMLKGQTVFSDNVLAPEYIEQLAKHNQQRMDWLFKESLSATKGLEFETIVDSDPSTWGNLRDELTGAGFNTIEIGHIIDGIFAANCLNQDKINQARTAFLASEAAALEALSSQKAEAVANFTPSGDHVKDLG